MPFNSTCILLKSPLTIYIFMFSEAFRAPVFTNGPDKSGFSLGFRRNVAEVFGSEAKYWIFPVFSS